MMRSLSPSLIVAVVLIVIDVAVAQDSVPPAQPKVSDANARHLIAMFSSGYSRGSNALKDSRRHYEVLQAETKNDPRIEYAFGLVLLKQLRNKDAVTQFQLATKPAGAPLYPAWQALIWSHFVAKDQMSGFDRLRAFAKLVAASKERDGLSNQQRAAEWIGEVMGALQKSADTVKQRATLQHEEESIQEILGQGLKFNYESGKSSVHSLHAALENDVQETKELALAKEERERTEKQAQVAKDLQASTERRDAIKKTNEEWKKYLESELAGFSKQLTRLERDYDFLQKRALSITASQLQLNTELGLLTQQTSNSNNNRPVSPVLGQVFEQRKNVLQVQLLNYQVEMDQTIVATALLSQKAQVIVSQRAALVQQYERATGQLVEKNAELDKWQERLKKDEEKLKMPATGKSKPVATKMQQVRSFRSYVDLDLGLERDRLLDTFGVTMPEVPDTVN